MDDIHGEWIRNLAANTPTLPIERLVATRDRMKAVLPDADVADYRRLIPASDYPIPIAFGKEWFDSRERYHFAGFYAS